MNRNVMKESLVKEVKLKKFKEQMLGNFRKSGKCYLINTQEQEIPELPISFTQARSHPNILQWKYQNSKADLKTVTEKQILYNKRNFYIEGQEERLGIYSEHREKNILNKASLTQHSRHQKLRTRAVGMEGCFSLTCSPYAQFAVYYPKTNCQGVVPLTVGCTFHIDY